MRARPIALWILLLLAPIGALPARTATQWIGTEPEHPRPGDTISVHLFKGQGFPGNELRFRSAEVGRFQRIWRSGRADLRGAEGLVPAGRFVAEEAGVILVAYDSANAREFSKALIVVGSPAAGDPVRWSELGQRLEIVPQTDPVELAERTGPIEFQILFDREPLAGVRVTAISASDPEEIRSATTDEIGMARLRLELPGAWLIATSHLERDSVAYDASLHLVVGSAR